MMQVPAMGGVSPSTEGALAAAEEQCRKAGARLTPLRRRVLGLLFEAPQPLGAYALLEQLQAVTGPVAPPTVYRALEFLLAQGLAHRLSSRSAYVPCMTCGAAPGHAHAFLLCQACGRAIEIEDRQVEQAIATMAGRSGFRALDRTVEVEGLCSGCRSHAGDVSDLLPA